MRNIQIDKQAGDHRQRQKGRDSTETQMRALVLRGEKERDGCREREKGVGWWRTDGVGG